MQEQDIQLAARCARLAEQSRHAATWLADNRETVGSEAEARTLVVNGFANPVSKELPMEYAVEMNNLIKLEMEGAIG